MSKLTEKASIPERFVGSIPQSPKMRVSGASALNAPVSTRIESDGRALAMAVAVCELELATIESQPIKIPASTAAKTDAARRSLLSCGPPDEMARS